MIRPDAPPLAARGSATVGVKTVQFTDASRQNRQITAEVWYPATGAQQTTAYDGVIGQTPVKIPGRANRNAAPAGGKFPLIITSHGQPGTRFQFAYLSEHLASRGFVVASLDHPGSTYQTLTQQNYISSIVDRPLDVLFAIAEVAKQVPSADPANVGLLGYSYGGYSVVNAAGASLDAAALGEYCRASGGEGPCFAQQFFAPLAQARGNLRPDPRVKAVMALAPYGQPWIGAKSLGALQVPLFVAAGEADDVATYKRDALEYYRGAGSRNKYLLTLAGAQHNPFVECPAEVRANEQDYWRCWEPVWDLERSHDLTRHFASAFFGRFLQNNAEAGNFLNPGLPGFKPRTTVGVKLETR
ncbi:MAG: prolyl oligopeptidase family serine peptidase [Meiothermus sp.]|nr:prolyl oligopeptidase family serine peptidase [Meiothermus sp.]